MLSSRRSGSLVLPAYLDPKRSSNNIWHKSGGGRGWRDFLERKCPTIKEVGAPYLVGGYLTVKYKISKVDEAPIIARGPKRE
jgi:hypothetical protein